MSQPARAKLSVLIPAGNEERHIADCIASARFADEVVVVNDAASTDRTREIAEGLADRVLVHEYVNSAAQKNWAIPQMTHPWVLVVDSDERVTPRLRTEIEAVLAADGPADGYRIYRLNHFMGQPIRGCGWQRDDVLRLFRRDIAKYEDKHVHADIVFPGKADACVEHLSGKFLHYTFESFDQYLSKFFKYGEWAAEDRAQKTPVVKWGHIAGRPIWRFFRQFVMYGGWRDGKAGFIICAMAAFSVLLKYARVWEKRQREAPGRE
ncbi:MAG: glycosyltransferase family 2 protein [Sumerlaeia bacterium]